MSRPGRLTGRTLQSASGKCKDQQENVLQILSHKRAALARCTPGITVPGVHGYIFIRTEHSERVVTDHVGMGIRKK